MRHLQQALSPTLRKCALALCGLPSLLFAQTAGLSESFNSGIPATFQNLDRDEWPLGDGFRGSVSGSWYVGYAYARQGKVAMSTSRHSVKAPAENWLITPQLTLGNEETWLTWDARSMHYDLPESYKVMISTTGNDPEDFVELARVDAESYAWAHHMVALTGYEGKSVYIAFLHDSDSKFILALDNLYVGELTETAFEGHNRSKYFCGDVGTTPVCGSIRNVGGPVELSELVCVSGVQEWSVPTTNATFHSNEEWAFSFDLPVRVGETTHYDVYAVTKSGNRYPVLSDSVICSYYPRTLLVEKATGTWCTACPGVIPFINKLKDRYGDEVVCVESHSEYQNIAGLSYPTYDRGMATSNYPVIYYNRAHEYPQYDTKSKLENVILRPTVALTNLVVEQQGDDSIQVHAQVVFAEDFDNTSDKFRLGFAILEKEIQLPIPFQKNNATQLVSEEYALIGSPIPADLMFYHNVVRGTESAFLGVAHSLPAQLTAGETYDFDTALAIPENVADRSRLSVVVFALNYWTDEVLNVSEAPLQYTPTGIVGTEQSAQSIHIQPNKEGCQIYFPENAPYVVRVYSLTGALLKTYQGYDDTAMVSLADVRTDAPCLIRAEQGNNSCSRLIRIHP